MRIKTKARFAGFLWLFALGYMASPPLAVSYASQPDRFRNLDVSGASQSAQDTFATFKAYAFDPAHPASATQVKLRVDGRTLWLTPISGNGPHLYAVVDNRAVRIEPANVRDWSLTGPDGRLYGNFTTREALVLADGAHASAMARSLSRDPLPKF